MFPSEIEIEGKKYFICVYFKDKKNASVIQEGRFLNFYLPSNYSNKNQLNAFDVLLGKIKKQISPNKLCSTLDNEDNSGFPQKLLINGKDYLIDIVLKNKKHASAVQDGNVLRFYLSSKISLKKQQEVFGFLLKNISKKLNDNFCDFKFILEDRRFVFAGEKFSIEFYKGLRYKFVDNTIYIPFHSHNINVIEKKILKYLIDRYEDRMRKYVLALNEQTFKHKVKDVKLGYFKSKYGHCTYDNQIAMNVVLLNASPEQLKYVVIHELAHIKEKNHSDRFWFLVESFCSNYRNIRKQMKSNPPLLFIRDL